MYTSSLPHTVKYVNNSTHTPAHYCALEQLDALLRHTMKGLDLTLQSILLLSTQLSFSDDEGCTESGRVFSGRLRVVVGVSGFDMTELEEEKAFSVCLWPLFSWSQCQAEWP